jgi:hypothetical protein
MMCSAGGVVLRNLSYVRYTTDTLFSLSEHASPLGNTADIRVNY